MIGRILLFDSADSYVGEIQPNEVMTAYVTEEIGGEHCMDIATTQKLAQAQRLLYQDAAGRWREYVVTGTDELHESGITAIGSYHAIWSIQYDLSGVYGDEQRPGIQTPVVASVALAAALSGTSRWTVGTVTTTKSGGLEMYNNNAWQRVCDVSGVYGGEVDSDITVGTMKVTARRVKLLNAVGSSSVTRRFDWARDVSSIRRRPQEGLRYCRVKPVGKGEESGDGFGRKITIGPVNNGKDWIQDDTAAQLYRMPDGSGGWEYPTLLVENPDIGDRQALKEWAIEHLHEWTRPVPTYEANVLQYAEAGMDVQGVALGDVVHIVDRGFGDEELRLEARVVRMVTSLLDPSDVQLTVGQIGSNLSTSLGAIAQSVGEVKSRLEVMYNKSGGTPTTSEYVSWLLQQVNARLNATGGYTYLKEGEGIWIYDKAEDQNPTKVINLTGGALRIADSKTQSGDWDWQLIMTASDGLLASAVTAAELTAGFIGSPSGNYWNLDSGELRMLSTAMVGDQTIQEYTDARAQAKADSAVAEAVIDISADIDNLQDQIDGAIETWFYSGTPTLSNQPANAWTTDDDKNNHLGDLYYDSATGKAYRFQLDGSTYKWQAIADSDIAKALSLSGEKKRVFYAASTSHPNPPYDVNDLWVQGGNGDILRCNTAKASGASYNASDWEKASKYTDDSELDNKVSGLKQEQVFDILFPVNPTTHKRANGATIKNGLLYMSSSFIDSGTLRAGMIKDVRGKSSWNLDNGTFKTVDAKISGTVTTGEGNNTKLVLDKGKLFGYRKIKKSGTSSYKMVGYIDSSAKVELMKSKGKSYNPKRYAYGLQLQSDQIVRISTPRLSVSGSGDVMKTTTAGFTGKLKLKKVIQNWRYDSGKFKYSSCNVTLTFRNGLLVDYSGFD